MINAQLSFIEHRQRRRDATFAEFFSIEKEGNSYCGAVVSLILPRELLRDG